MKPMRNSAAAVSILFVEDDLETNDILSHMIAQKFPDVVVHVAENGPSGLNLCTKHLPDIVITDINMPAMDGIQMAEEIRSLKPDMKFIILSGYSEKYYLEKLSHLGISEYLLKPIDIKALFVTIDKYLQQIWQERNARC